jgi:hypothetical protein
MRAISMWVGVAFLCVAMLSGCPKRSEEPPRVAPETKATPTTPTTPAAAPTPSVANTPEAIAAPTPASSAPPHSGPTENPAAASASNKNSSSDPSPIKKTPGFDPNAPDRGCKTDADCAVKDVGNCCGYFPLCVHRNAKTDPAAVRAQCEKDGMASICGFQDVQGCRCVQGRCENIADGAVVM